MTSTPRVFISYSHDSEEHKSWTLTLATRLVANGVDIILDQWDMGLGGDLPKFMESGLTKADRIIAICTESYIEKSNSGTGGVGYEKMILTASLMQNIDSTRIIPLIRTNSSIKTPTFLSSKLFVDFRADDQYEARYAELLRDIHGQKANPRPPIGQNPFEKKISFIDPVVTFSSERYVSPANNGQITFDYSNNNGRFVLGAGDMLFETAWSRASNTAIHVMNDAPSIRTIAIAIGAVSFDEIADASLYDTSSRNRTPHLGEIIIWQNSSGYYLATKIESLRSRSHGEDRDEITFSYKIARDKSAEFNRAL